MTSTDPTLARTRLWAAAVEVLAVLAVAIARRIGFASQVDLHIADEVMYLNRGRAIVHGELGSMDLAYSPPYCVSLGTLDLLPLGSSPAADWMYWLAGIASALALWWALRPLTSGPVACLAAAWWTASPSLLHVHGIGASASTQVYAFTTVLVFAAFGALMRQRINLAAALLLLATITRSEFTLWLMAFGLALLLFKMGRWRSWPTLICLGGGGLLFALQLSHPTLRERSWQAFSQHYARAAVTEDLMAEYRQTGGELTQERVAQAAARLKHAWTAPDERVAQDFGDARSPLSAMRNNPERFCWRVGQNAAGTPPALLRVFDTTLVAAPMVPWLGIGLLSLAALGLGRRTPTRRLPPAPTVWFGITMVGIVPIILLVAPRTELLYPTLLLAAVPIAMGLGRLGVDRRPGTIPCSGIMGSGIMALLLLVAAVFGPRPFGLPPREDFEHRSAVQLLAREFPNGRVRVLAPHATAYAALLGYDRVQPINLRLEDLPTDVETWLGERRPDVIVAGPSLDRIAARLPALKKLLAGPDWQVRATLGAATLYEPSGH